MLKISNLALTSLAALTLFTVPSHAQNQAFQLPTRAHASQAVSADVSAANELAAKQKATAVNPLATESCSYKFTSGSGNTYLQFCVTANGNIVEFQSPVGVEQLSPQTAQAFEGYGICDGSTSTGYFDYANTDSGNWNAPVLVSQTATAVKIARTTSDGLWTLTQTFTSTPGTNPYAKVTMALKNNSGIAKGVVLVRFANAVPDNSGSTSQYIENYDGTLNSAFAWLGVPGTANGGPYGLMLQAVGNPTPGTVPYLREGFAIDTLGGPDPCNPGANWIGQITSGMGSFVYWYDFSLNKLQTVTVNERYMSY